jgi:hypothetical protein
MARPRRDHRDTGGITEYRCSICSEWKLSEQFHRDVKTYNGLRTRCKVCVRDLAKTRPRNRIYDPLKRREYTVRGHGLTIDEYDRRLEAQGGGCAVCGSKDPREGKVSFAIDHDHACCPGEFSCGGCVRGLLCGPCNRSLGTMGDDSDRLRAAADYLDLAALSAPRKEHSK